MEKLYVFYEQDLVGEIERRSDATLSFRYSTAWKENVEAFDISPQLSRIHEGGFDHRQTAAFFENLIPEGLVKRRLEKLVGSSLDSSFNFLKEFGLDAAGAFVISPHDHLPKSKLEYSYKEVNIEKLSQAHLSNEHLLLHTMETYGGRFSLAGAQDKVPAIYADGRVFIGAPGTPSTHILKPPHFNKSVKDSVHNEYFCMRLAAAIGMEVPDIDVIEASVPFFLIERYDRRFIDEGIARLHQIDFCQAQGKLVSEKYEEDGGPTLLANYRCLLEQSSQGILDAKRFMQWICFNILVANNDSHSKNISLLYEQQSARLAPFYDLLCTGIYPAYSPRFAFKIGGRANWDQWRVADFREEMNRWGLSKSPDLLLGVLRSTADEIHRHLPSELRSFKERFPSNRVAARIKNEIEKRIGSLEKRKVL